MIRAGAEVIICLAVASRMLTGTPTWRSLALAGLIRVTSRPGTASPLPRRCAGTCGGTARPRPLLRCFPGLRLAVPATALHQGRGDGLVLRGLSGLPGIS